MTAPSIPPLRQPPAESTWQVVRDVYAVPGKYCLYDDSGRRIDRSVSWTAGRRRGPAPDRIKVPESAHAVDQQAVFGGLFPKAHFGHVLLEMFTRLWIYDSGHADVAIPIVHFTHYQRDLEVFEERLLGAAFDGPGPPRIHVDRPLRLREVLVPSQAVVLGEPMQPAMLPIYDRIRRALAGDVERSTTPLYLSRSRLPDDRRLTLGEVALEERLRRRGAHVVHPQELPLELQIRLVAASETVIGLAGSALHLTVLRELSGSQTVSLDPRSPFVIQQDVDRLRGSRFHHVHAQFPLHPRLLSGRAVEVGRYRNLLLPRRVERAIAALL